jgi:hypothetical protein
MKYSISVLLVLVAATARAQLENHQDIKIPDYVNKYGILESILRSNDTLPNM